MAWSRAINSQPRTRGNSSSTSIRVPDEATKVTLRASRETSLTEAKENVKVVLFFSSDNEEFIPLVFVGSSFRLVIDKETGLPAQYTRAECPLPSGSTRLIRSLLSIDSDTSVRTGVEIEFSGATGPLGERTR